MVSPELSNRNFIFNVTGFSTYTTTSNSVLSASATNGYSSKILPEELVHFYVNYSNKTSGENISGAECNISFNSTPVTMYFNSTLLKYHYNRSFADELVRSYEVTYNVTCNATDRGYEGANVTDTFSVQLNETIFENTYLLEGLGGLGTRASLLVSPTDVDNNTNLILMGLNDTERITLIFYNNNHIYSNVNQSRYSGYTMGTLSVKDTDKNNDYELLTMGSYSGNNLGNITIFKKS